MITTHPVSTDPAAVPSVSGLGRTPARQVPGEGVRGKRELSGGGKVLARWARTPRNWARAAPAWLRAWAAACRVGSTICAWRWARATRAVLTPGATPSAALATALACCCTTAVPSSPPRPLPRLGTHSRFDLLLLSAALGTSIRPGGQGLAADTDLQSPGQVRDVLGELQGRGGQARRSTVSLAPPGRRRSWVASALSRASSSLLPRSTSSRSGPRVLAGLSRSCPASGATWRRAAAATSAPADGRPSRRWRASSAPRPSRPGCCPTPRKSQPASAAGRRNARATTCTTDKQGSDRAREAGQLGNVDLGGPGRRSGRVGLGKELIHERSESMVVGLRNARVATLRWSNSKPFSHSCGECIRSAQLACLASSPRLCGLHSGNDGGGNQRISTT